MDLDGLGQEVHILPRLAILVLAPDTPGEPLVLVLGQDPGHVMVGGVVHAEDVVTPLHDFPIGYVPHTRNNAPRVEAFTLFSDALQLLSMSRSEATKYRLPVDLILYGLHKVLLGFGAPCGKDEYLGHQLYSVYLEAFPLTSSAGYFCPLIATFALAASTGSMPSLS